MAYADLLTIQTLNVGDILTAACMQQARANEEFLIDPPCCSVFNSAAVTLTTAVQTTLNANSENFDNDSMHSTSSNTSRITAQTAGRYLLLATVVFDPDATGERNVDFLKNGVTALEGTKITANTSGSQGTYITSVRTVVLAASDYVEVRARQRSGGNLDARLDEFFAGFWTR